MPFGPRRGLDIPMVRVGVSVRVRVKVRDVVPAGNGPSGLVNIGPGVF